jgi:hypothetical protein
MTESVSFWALKRGDFNSALKPRFFECESGTIHYYKPKKGVGSPCKYRGSIVAKEAEISSTGEECILCVADRSARMFMLHPLPSTEYNPKQVASSVDGLQKAQQILSATLAHVADRDSDYSLAEKGKRNFRHILTGKPSRLLSSSTDVVSYFLGDPDIRIRDSIFRFSKKHGESFSFNSPTSTNHNETARTPFTFHVKVSCMDGTIHSIKIDNSFVYFGRSRPTIAFVKSEMEKERGYAAEFTHLFRAHTSGSGKVRIR